MRIPDQLTADSISAWEDAYFGSEFTHPSGAVRLTKHRRGFGWALDEFEGQRPLLPDRHADRHKGDIVHKVFLKVGADTEVQKLRRKVERVNEMKHVPLVYLATAMALQGMTKQELEALKLWIEERAAIP